MALITRKKIIYILSSILEFKIPLLLFKLLEKTRIKVKIFLKAKAGKQKKQQEKKNKKHGTQSGMSVTGNINGLRSLLKAKTSSGVAE